jgi:4-amino-4-deoxy-L-arabinose transferase-like glycosyltransferase
MIPRFRYCVWLVGTALLALQLVFLTGPGIEEDEALFVLPFTRGNPSLYEWHAGRFHIPVMSMDYLGGLKSWLYWPVFQIWEPNVWSMRLPACFLSVVTVLLFAHLARRAAGNRVALAAAVFLATDAMFVLINVFDMTVTLLLLATVLFLGLLQRFSVSGRKRFLGAAFLTAGLALWYKAIFIFPLAGMLVAFVIAYPRDVWRSITLRNVTVAAVSILAGAAPLVVFNWERRGATVHASGELPSAPALEKLVMLQHTLDGRAFEHYMFRSSLNEKVPLDGATIDLVLRWYRESRFGPGSALLPALVLSFLALPFLSRGPLFPPLLFSWVAMAAAYGAMFVFRDAGAGPHHAVLLDPAPHFIVAATAAALSERWLGRRNAVLVAFCAVLVASNIWLLGRYAHAAHANGFSVYWTDGVKNLAQVIGAQSLPVAVLDWGIHNGLEIESRGSITFIADPAPRENVLYVTHCDGYVLLPVAQFPQLLAASGLHKTASRAVADKKGHLVFCLFQLTKD